MNEIPLWKRLLNKISNLGKPEEVAARYATQTAVMTQKELEMLRRFGASMSELTELMHQHSTVNHDRWSLYKEIDRALQHPIMAAAGELYADIATCYSSFHSATVWVTAQNSKYENELNTLLDKLGMEERVFDWAWTTAVYGDMFVRLDTQPGLGIVAIDDSEHPLNMSRLDLNGKLIGFFNTPMAGKSEKIDIKTPWDYVHIRILGAKKRRPQGMDPAGTQYSSISLMTPDNRRVSSKYGTSVLSNGLPVYKRLKLAEDSVMLARLSKGILRYIYKVKVDGGNMEAVSELVDQYKTLLKRARALNTSPEGSYFDEKYNPLGVNEDIILPVWGDVNDFEIEKIGGEADIRWIADVEELRNQLACALRIPLQLLGGYIDEMPQGLGRGAVERYDIRFARQARRLQRAQIDGITRMCQIHLALQGLDPSESLFSVNMSETSTAEEEELKEGLNSGVDTVEKMSNLVLNTFGAQNIDRVALVNYLNKKILKLDDLDLNTLLKKQDDDSLPESVKDMISSMRKELKEAKDVMAESRFGSTKRISVSNMDLRAFLPNKKGLNESWKEKYGSVKVRAKASPEKR